MATRGGKQVTVRIAHASARMRTHSMPPSTCDAQRERAPPAVVPIRDPGREAQYSEHLGHGPQLLRRHSGHFYLLQPLTILLAEKQTPTLNTQLEMPSPHSVPCKLRTVVYVIVGTHRRVPVSNN